ncbi:MAG: hypothetical protein ABIK65_09025 [Candidatus Eisenbacteria bacterium]
MRAWRTGYRLTAILLIAGALGGGCASSRKSGFVHPGVDFGFIRRVAILPFQNLSPDEYADERIHSIFMMEILEEGSLELVGTGEVLAAMLELRLMADSDLSPAQLVSLGQRLGVDALFFGTVEEYGMDRSSRDRGNEVTALFGLAETETGTAVWQSQVNVTGMSTWKRLFGGSSASLHEVSRKSVREALGTLL